MDVLRNPGLFVKTKKHYRPFIKATRQPPCQTISVTQYTMDFHHFSDMFSPFFTALPGHLHPREQSKNIFSLFFFFLLSQIMKKDVDINVTGVLWYIFNVWEKIETQGENKQACKDLCVWRIWYLQMRLSKSCKCFIVVFFYFFSGTMTANESCPGTNHHSSW